MVRTICCNFSTLFHFSALLLDVKIQLDVELAKLEQLAVKLREQEQLLESERDQLRKKEADVVRKIHDVRIRTENKYRV